MAAFNLNFQSTYTQQIHNDNNDYDEEHQQLMTDWQVFKSTHMFSTRRGHNQAEEDRKFRLFSTNWKKVAEHNKLADKRESSYRTAINDLSVWTDAQNERLGGVPTNIPDSDFYNLTDAQASIELRVLLSNLTTTTTTNTLNRVRARDTTPEPAQKSYYSNQGPVKNQYSCGGCWSFAVTGVVETLHALKDKSRAQRLSEQQVIDCNRKNYGCEGGYPSRGFDYVRENGIVKEVYYPYRAKQQSCFANRQNHQPRLKVRGNGKIPYGNERYMKTLLAKLGPVAVAVDAHLWGFLHYKSGVYDDASCSQRKVNHAVIVVGYGTENGKDFWLIKNSWGSTWGLGGYMKLARNKNNMCGIASLGSYAYL